MKLFKLRQRKPCKLGSRCRPRWLMLVQQPPWRNGHAPTVIILKMVTCRSYLSGNPVPRRLKQLHQFPRQRKWRIGKYGGIYFLDNNSSTRFYISDRLALFPDSTRIRNDSLFIAGQDLAFLADRYLTPLYIYDRATMDASVIAYKGALRDYYPAESEITYAGKAFLCKAIAEWTQAHDLFVDCTGQGEIAIAVAGGVPHERIIVHGVNKSISDLQAAIEYSGTIVADNLTELERIATLFSETAVTTQTRFPDIWLRLLPGVAVTTHHSHTQTGQQDSKFGMTREELLKAARFCYQHNLPFNGIHFHQGSNFRDISPLLSAIELGLDIADALGF